MLNTFWRLGMSMKMPLVTIALLMAVPLAAQRGRGGGNLGGGGDVGGGAPAMVPRTPFEVIADDLKLDRKAQLPAVTELFVAAEQESFAIVEEMLGLRQQMLNVETRGASDPTGAVTAAYATAVEKMVALEARVFSQTYALLTPNQHSRAPKAFAQLAGFFKTLPPRPGAAPSAGQSGGRGGAR
jgi:hypothetical protein